MNRLKLFTLQIFLVSVTTLTAPHWKTSSQTAGATEAQTAGPVKVEGVESTLGADQANKVSNTGVDVTETQNIDTSRALLTGRALIDTEGADPRSDRNYSFDTEKDPAAVSGRNKIDGSGEIAQAKAPAPKALGLVPFTEAPADFDDKTNDPTFVSPCDFDKDKDAFEEVEEILPDGLGPVYNAQSCSACHQNPVTGAIAQITELRAGHNVRTSGPGGDRSLSSGTRPAARSSTTAQSRPLTL